MPLAKNFDSIANTSREKRIASFKTSFFTFLSIISSKQAGLQIKIP